MKWLKKIGHMLMSKLGFDSEERRHLVDEGLLDFGGQGRNKYGK